MGPAADALLSAPQRAAVAADALLAAPQGAAAAAGAARDSAVAAVPMPCPCPASCARRRSPSRAPPTPTHPPPPEHHTLVRPGRTCACQYHAFVESLFGPRLGARGRASTMRLLRALLRPRPGAWRVRTAPVSHAYVTRAWARGVGVLAHRVSRGVYRCCAYRSRACQRHRADGSVVGRPWASQACTPGRQHEAAWCPTPAAATHVIVLGRGAMRVRAQGVWAGVQTPIHNARPGPAPNQCT